MNEQRINQEKMAAARQAHEQAKTGEDFSAALREFHQKQLEEIAVDADVCEITHVSIEAFGPGDITCRACQQLQDKVLKLDDELRAPTLPHSDCTCRRSHEGQPGFCLCRYEPVFADEF